MGDLSEHFSRKEFECKCGCGSNNISMDLITQLERLRKEYGRPITIASGCRCVKHNADIGGVPNSAHICKEGKEGEAADIPTASSAEMYIMLDKIFFYSLFNRIEVDEKHIHVDVSKTLPQNIFDVRPIKGDK